MVELLVIDRLEVGPPRLEAARIVMPYAVVNADGRHETELIYRYEEPVLDPGGAADANLAAMTGAQVALNYGLFCRRIVFRGAYDEADRAFLRKMAENTAREIYVKKFLEPNPFLVGEAAALRVERRERYLQAELVFEDPPPAAGRAPAAASDPARHAILSSGGKDSLLTYALLEEMGREVHPVFLNESGRHWFTALNGYRLLRERSPATARVWTNCDRLFAWMLRFLPFVRKDFASVRSDEYPIRLWTVAVFLFGALPVLRRRGIGRLLIGDEFDTTRRASHEGIAHYDGLYDQSRFFDRALSRYFARKGWGICQFSMLRPLSEFLVQKILAERYPDCQAVQVSCHAAHVEGDRVRPCGRCEKCRRIVSMLVAIGADPAHCGYAERDIDACLAAFAQRGVHQEGRGAQHIAHLLEARGRWPAAAADRVAPRAHPEVEQLRFDAEHAPLDTLPPDLRKPLYEILLQHATGAVQRVGKNWVRFDPLSEASLSAAFPFASHHPRPDPMQDATPSDAPAKRTWLLGHLSWPEAQQRLKEVDIALLPVGAVEQHGPHLPLDTDAFDAAYLADKVAEACSEPRPLVLPPIPYGVSYHHDDFSGTLSVAPGTLAQLVYEIGMSAARHGVTKLLIINGHGGNVPALQFAAQMINRDTRIFTCVESGETSDPDINAIAETPGDVHAGEIETSTSLAVRPDLVNMGKAQRAVPQFVSRYLDFSSKYSVDWYARTKRISRTGVLGDPTKATAEKGRRMWEVMIRHLAEFVEELKGMSLDDIHQVHRL